MFTWNVQFSAEKIVGQQRELQNLIFLWGWQMVLFFEIDDL